jgi:gamma-glutamylcyclotransferase (GGCT)/AIG2-like uncharacterized protein YtfP
MEYIFSYGTLQKDEVQIRLFGRLLDGERDLLKGYKTSAVEITDKEFLATGEDNIQQTLVSTNNPEDSVKGVVFEISGEELLLADKYEPDNYSRIKVEFVSGNKAWIYVAD